MVRNSDKLPISRGQRLLRYVGATVLSACAVMLILGLTLLRERFHGLQFFQYWAGCFLLAIAAIFCALWDMLLVRRAFHQGRRQLFREQFGALGDKVKNDNEKKN